MKGRFGVQGEQWLYLSVGCAVRLGLAEAAGGGGSQVSGSSQQQVPGGRVAGSLGTGSLCSQEPWGSWNREKGSGLVSGRHRHQPASLNRELFAAPNQPRGHAWDNLPHVLTKRRVFHPESPLFLIMVLCTKSYLQNLSLSWLWALGCRDAQCPAHRTDQPWWCPLFPEPALQLRAESSSLLPTPSTTTNPGSLLLPIQSSHQQRCYLVSQTPVLWEHCM